jgi:hypothetical protein
VLFGCGVNFTSTRSVSTAMNTLAVWSPAFNVV